MDETTAGTTEDYQENLTVDYSEMPTSIGFTSNKTTILLLLNIKSMVSYIKEQLYSLAMIKFHDMQQVSAFEERMFEILREKIPHEIISWQRWTDGAGHEFRSRFCNAELLKLKKTLKLENASFEYFEAHEGKNVSDALGSIIKNKVKRIMTEYPHGVRSAAEIVELLSIMPDATEKFSFMVVEDFKEISRIPAEERVAIMLPNILKLNSISC